MQYTYHHILLFNFECPFASSVALPVLDRLFKVVTLTMAQPCMKIKETGFSVTNDPVLINMHSWGQRLLKNEQGDRIVVVYFGGGLAKVGCLSMGTGKTWCASKHM